MKNKFSLATLMAVCLVAVSCSTDTDGTTTFSQKQNQENSIKTDSISIAKTTFATDDGTIPPIKP